KLHESIKKWGGGWSSILENEEDFKYYLRQEGVGTYAEIALMPLLDIDVKQVQEAATLNLLLDTIEKCQMSRIVKNRDKELIHSLYIDCLNKVISIAKEENQQISTDNDIRVRCINVFSNLQHLKMMDSDDVNDVNVNSFNSKEELETLQFLEEVIEDAL